MSENSGIGSGHCDCGDPECPDGMGCLMSGIGAEDSGADCDCGGDACPSTVRNPDTGYPDALTRSKLKTLNEPPTTKDTSFGSPDWDGSTPTTGFGAAPSPSPADLESTRGEWDEQQPDWPKGPNNLWVSPEDLERIDVTVRDAAERATELADERTGGMMPSYYYVPGIFMVADEDALDHPQLSAMDLAEALNYDNGDGYNIGCIIKYLVRRGRKPGATAIRDMEKLINCAKRELARLKDGDQ